jgi:hypothetical protein
MKFKQKCIESSPFMIHKNYSTNGLIVNNLGNDGESLIGGALNCTTFSKKTYAMTASVVGIVWSTTKTTGGSHTCVAIVDASDGKGGGGGSHMGASTMDGCNEKCGGVGGIWVQPLWMDGMGKMMGVGGDEPPRVVQVTIKPLG